MRTLRVFACVIVVVAAACSSSSSRSSAPPRASSSSSTSTPPPSTTTLPRSNTVWLCRPGLAKNPCEAPLDATVVPARGANTVERAAPAKNPAVDCFYVYPTVSAQTTPVATLHIDPEETAIAINQASRFSQVCRVYAPMYRQATIAAITGAAKRTSSLNVGYDDVVTAWRDYLTHDNNGRGVVLIGHSQGSFVLTRLIQSEIDTKPDVRARLVSALLLGGNVTVADGRDVGGAFKNIPVCRTNTQNGCVVAYSTFLDPPPVGSLFGRSRTAGQHVVCVNPAAVAGGSAAVRSYFTTAAFPGPIGAVSGKVPTAPTPWVAYPKRYTARCVTANGATWLQITPMPGDSRPTVAQTLGPTWGLHLYDVNLALGELVDLVGHEAAAHRRDAGSP